MNAGTEVTSKDGTKRGIVTYASRAQGREVDVQWIGESGPRATNTADLIQVKSGIEAQYPKTTYHVVDRDDDRMDTRGITLAEAQVVAAALAKSGNYAPYRIVQVTEELTA